MPNECAPVAKSVNRKCTADARPLCRRARITNDLYMMNGVNRSSALGRRFKDLATAFATALGGEGRLSELQRADVKRAAELAVLSEQIRLQALQSKPVDLADLVKLEGAADRAVRRLGLRQYEHPGRNPHGQFDGSVDVSAPSPHERLAKKLDVIAERITNRVAAMAIANGAPPSSLGFADAGPKEDLGAGPRAAGTARET
jgi:hypothetical protein